MELEDFGLIENATMNAESVELSKQTKLNGIYNSTLIDCDIVLDPKGMPSSRLGSRFNIARNVLERCTIHAKGRVHKFNVAESVVFRHCKFVGGPFTEPVFGSGILSDSNYAEIIEMCDFTECDLRDARFYTTNIQQLKLPDWPHIAIVARDGDQVYATPSEINPAFSRLRDEVRAFGWSDSKLAKIIEFAVYAVGDGRDSPNIVVQHAEDIVRLGGGTLQLLKAELDRFAHPALRY